VPKLSLDRPFTYLVPEDAEAGMGNLVSVPFHGRTVKGWVLGPATEDIPSARIRPIRTVLSPVRFFDHRMLRLLRWVSERYLAPLATVIDRSHPPRVASEERLLQSKPTSPGEAPVRSREGRNELLPPGMLTWVRPLPGEEAQACLRAVGACIASGRQAIVLVPEAAPVPHVARSVLETFGPDAVAHLGGDGRTRYRTWLTLLRDQPRIVVGTRPAVFAPMRDVGLIWLSREVHPGHREDRSPYHHVREVAAARARLEGCAFAVASLSPSVETAEELRAGTAAVRRPDRPAERARAPLVETAPPEAEDRSSRLARLLKRARSAALIVSRSGYGVARTCRSCGEPAACAVCRGTLVLERGQVSCRVCGAPGRCANCGGGSFGVERSGAERIAEWSRGLADVPVKLADSGSDGEDPEAVPGPGRIVVGTAAAVNDLGPLHLELVAILDPDRALMRPGVHAGERALATWMEAAAWAGPRGSGARVLAQTRRPGHPAIQALVRWDPLGFLRHEAEQRAQAGFPPGYPVFRIEGDPALSEALPAAPVETVLTSAGEGGQVCLVAVRPGELATFRRAVLALVDAGVVTRVEAEPQS
jgi:primosomal protein N' (replication factor Y)